MVSIINDHTMIGEEGALFKRTDL